MSLKKFLLKTPLSKTLKDIEAYTHQLKVERANDKSIQHNATVYCVSPYKTGTTFLASCYGQDVAQHEPMQYYTLKKFDTGSFDAIFIKRLNALDLKLECSGFLSGYIEQLANNELTKDLTYICLLRTPTQWVNSVVNYWYKLRYLKNDYINELFWKKIVGVDLIGFHELDEKARLQVAETLVAFYLKYLEQTRMLPNIHYIPLPEIEQALPKIDELLNEKATLKETFKRENTDKFFTYENEQANERYRTLIDQLT